LLLATNAATLLTFGDDDDYHGDDDDQPGTGISCSLKACNPTKYDHSTGGGSSCDAIKGPLDGYYFACAERASFFLTLSTGSSFSYSSTTIFTFDFTSNPALQMKSVINNCQTSVSDASSVCHNGESVSISFSGNSIQVKKLQKNARVVIRLDFSINCDALGSSSPAISFTQYRTGTTTVPITGCNVGFTRPSSVFNCMIKMLVPLIPLKEALLLDLVVMFVRIVTMEMFVLQILVIKLLENVAM